MGFNSAFKLLNYLLIASKISALITYKEWKASWVISFFRSGVYEIIAFLGCYAAAIAR
jgi:hypothetical protein